MVVIGRPYHRENIGCILDLKQHAPHQTQLMTTPDQRHDGNKLPAGYKLHNYRILGVLGEGGFGITYLAEDEMLHQKVAIKEYFPTTLATRDATTAKLHTAGGDAGKYFKWGLDRFISEARIMAKIDHPNIVRVFNFATMNDTGYMVMPYEDGEPLDRWVKQFSGQKVPPDTVISLLEPITRALGVIHEMGLIHRDVKPANIFLRKTGSPVLLDFGAARSTVSAASQTVAAIVSAGYSPIEQYSDLGKQGPWTDIYATAAVAYRLVTGKVPPDAPTRISAEASGEIDKCEKLADMTLPGYAPGFLKAIDEGLQVRPQMRPQSIAAWRGQLGFEPIKDVREGGPSASDGDEADWRPRLVETKSRPSSGMLAAAGVVALAVLGGGAYLALQPSSSDTPAVEAATKQTQKAAAKPTEKQVVTVAKDDTPSKQQAVNKSDTPSPTPTPPKNQPVTQQRQAALETPQPPTPEPTPAEEPPARSAPATPPAYPSPGLTQRQQGLEQILSGSILWTVLRMEFPDWYATRLERVSADTNLPPTRRAVTQRLLPDLKALRLQQAKHVMLAPSELKQVAAVYTWNLQVLQEHSDAACHDGIMRGEDTIFMSKLLDHQGAPFETLYGLIFRAAAVGRKLPNNVGNARQTDYDELTKMLRGFGWKQKDFDLFTDEARFAAAPPAQACKMVLEWFRAHLAITNEATQSRLLKVSLRPILAE